jgi:hypothetical protein
MFVRSGFERERLGVRACEKPAAFDVREDNVMRITLKAFWVYITLAGFGFLGCQPAFASCRFVDGALQGACEHRLGEHPAGDPAPFKRVSANVLHAIDSTAVIYIKNIRTIKFSPIQISLERDTSGRIHFSASGSVNPEDADNAWLSHPISMQYRALDRQGNFIGSPMTVFFQLKGKGGNGAPLSYDNRAVELPFDDVAAIKSLPANYDVILNDN